MTRLLVSCVVLYLVSLTLHVAADDDWYQKPIEPPFFNKIEQTRNKYRKRGVGQPCRSTSDCYNRLCCMKSNSGTKTCKPMSRFGYSCTDEQAKGGYYLGSCPCQSRYAECIVYRRRTNIGVCSYRRWN
uniref:Ixodegrin B n=1 Tax=Rhipicephalus appendiculatus TaxID=34631 RepID=A0A131YT01_RHIAP